MKRSVVTAAIAAAALASPAVAQEKNEDGAVRLEPILIESLTRVETPVDEATRAVTVISREEIEERKLIDRSVGEILSHTVPGFSPSTEATTDFGQTLRGRSFLVLIDGVPQSTPLRDGRRSLNTIDPESIERIEVVRGGTSMYGFGATGGLVNIVTKRPEAGEMTVKASQGFKVSATHPEDSLESTTSLQVSGSEGAVDYLLDGSFIKRNSFFDSDGDRITAEPFAGQGGLADTETYNFLGKIGYSFAETQRLELSGLWFELEQRPDYGRLPFVPDWRQMFAVPAEGYKTPALPGSYNVATPGTENKNVNLEYSNSDLFGSSISSQVYYTDLDIVYGKLPPYSQSMIESDKLGGRLTITTPVKAGPLPFDIVWGADYLRDETKQTFIDTPDYNPNLVQDAFAAFGQIEVPILEYGKIAGGMRYEDITVDVSTFNQNAATVVQGGELGFQETLFNLTGAVYLSDEAELFGGWSQGFTITELGRILREGNFTRAEQAATEAEKSDNYEIGLRGTYKRWDGSLAGFLSKSDNGVTYDRTNLRILTRPERIYGVEGALNVRPNDRLTLGGTVTWMKGKIDLDNDGDYDEDLPSTRIPPLKVTAFAEYDVTEWWSARLSGLYSGSRNPDSTQFGGGDIDEYMVFDLYSTFDVGPGELQVGIENLFNNDYMTLLNQAYNYQITNVQAPGTTIAATYSVRF